MEETSSHGRNTPGVGNKPSTPVPHSPASGSVGSLLPPSPVSMSSPLMPPTSHGAARYGYSMPSGHHHHMPNMPYSQMVPVSGASASAGGHPVGVHPQHGHYGQPGAFHGPNHSHPHHSHPQHQMHHPSQQQQQPQQTPGGQPYHNMPPMPMMPPPSQYPSKPIMQPSQSSPNAAVAPHHSMMPTDRSVAMSYYQSRYQGPNVLPPTHHSHQHPQQAPNAQQQNAYYMRAAQQQTGPTNKNYYAQGNGNNGGMPPVMPMAGQHPHNQPQQPPHHPVSSAGMTIHHHHQQQQPQQQQHPHQHLHGSMSLTTAHSSFPVMGSVQTESGVPTSSGSSPVGAISLNQLHHHQHGHSYQQQQQHHSGENLRHPQPPPIIEELSQTSTTSSQAADENSLGAPVEMPTPKVMSGGSKHHISHPSTPNNSNLGSPGAASMSSYHDDFDSMSSPSWPRTPASPALSQAHESHHHSGNKRSEAIQKLYEMSDEPERRAFLEKYLQFLEERGSPLCQVPTISKIPLDLYCLYMSVKERGGFLEVHRSKLWKECAQICNIALNTSAGYTLRKQYMKHLLAFECKFDRGNIDPEVVVQMSETSGSTKKKAAAAASANKQAAVQSSSNVSARQEQTQAPYHYPHYPQMPLGSSTGTAQQQPTFDSEQFGGGYPPNASVSSSGAVSNGPYPSGSQYAQHHSEQFAPSPYGSSGGQMPSSASSQSAQPGHGSVSIKDPFLDDVQHANASSASANYSSRSQHYPNSQSKGFAGSPMGRNTCYSYGITSSSQTHTGPQHQHSGAAATAPSASANYNELHPHYGPLENHQHQYGSRTSASTSASEPVPSGNNLGHGSQYPVGAGFPSVRMNGPSNHGVNGYFGPNQQFGQPMSYGAELPLNHSQGRHAGAPYPDHPQHQTIPRPIGPGMGQEHNRVQLGLHPGQPTHRYASPTVGGFPGSPRPSYNSNQAVASTGSMPPPQYPRGLAPSLHGNEQYGKLDSFGNAYPATPSNICYSNTASGTAGSASSPNSPSGSAPSQAKNNHHHQAGGHVHSSSGNSNLTWIPPSRYGQPKRHPDFIKPGSEQYQATGNYPTGSYHNYPSHNRAQPNVASNQPIGWNRENTSQYRSAPSPFGYQQQSSSTMTNREAAWHESSRSQAGHSMGNQSITGLSGNGGNWPSSQRGYPPAYGHEYPPHSAHYSGGQAHAQVGYGIRPDMQQSSLVYGPTSIMSQVAPSCHAMPKTRPTNPLSSSNDAHRSRISQTNMTNSHPYQQPHQQELLAPSCIFPPDSVEATLPKNTKRRKLTARDVAPVEAWRLYMALKSGLLAESTYALDVLSIYSNDDSTLIYLGLSNMPGLLDVLLEHYKKCLNEMFDNIYDDTEVGYEATESLQGKMAEKYDKVSGKVSIESTKTKWYEREKDVKKSNKTKADKQNAFLAAGSSQILLDMPNYTNVTRQGKLVKVKRVESLRVYDLDKKWDQTKCNFAYGYEHWARGGGETTSHICTHLESKESLLRPVNVLNTPSTSKTTESESDEEIDVVCLDDQEQKSHTKENDSEAEKKESKEEKAMKEFLNDEQHYPKIRESDRLRFWKLKHQPEFEDETNDHEMPSIAAGHDYHQSLKSRCLVISNLIRNLSFVTGNDTTMAKHPGLLLMLSRLLLLHHEHAPKKPSPTADINFDRLRNEPEYAEQLLQQSIKERAKLQVDEPSGPKIWWDSLHTLRENTMVTFANIAGQLSLSPFPEHISLTILDGILHWAVCPSAYAQDALLGAHWSLSPRRLAYEILCKMSIIDSNVDLMLATPPLSRIDTLIGNLCRSLVCSEEQTMREFSLVLLSNFAPAEQHTARTIATCGNTLSLLLNFIEHAEQYINMVNMHGLHSVKNDIRFQMVDLNDTTLDMLRRAASTLHSLARVPENRSLFIQLEERLLTLTMSRVLDPSVTKILADTLFECSKPLPRKWFEIQRYNQLPNMHMEAVERPNGNDNDSGQRRNHYLIHPALATPPVPIEVQPTVKLSQREETPKRTHDELEIKQEQLSSKRRKSNESATVVNQEETTDSSNSTEIASDHENQHCDSADLANENKTFVQDEEKDKINEDYSTKANESNKQTDETTNNESHNGDSSTATVSISLNGVVHGESNTNKGNNGNNDATRTNSSSISNSISNLIENETYYHSKKQISKEYHPSIYTEGDHKCTPVQKGNNITSNGKRIGANGPTINNQPTTAPPPPPNSAIEASSS